MLKNGLLTFMPKLVGFQDICEYAHSATKIYANKIFTSMSFPAS